MSAARWVVIGTALAAATTATYMLMGPSEQKRSSGGANRSVSEPVDPREIAPQDQIDAESRDAMRKFLRQSVQEPVQEPAEESKQEPAREEEAMKRNKELDW